VSNRGPQFTSHVWKAVFHLLEVSVRFFSGYHSQTNSQTKTQNLMSPAVIVPPSSTYLKMLPTMGRVITPFQYILGYQPPLFSWSGEPSQFPARRYGTQLMFMCKGQSEDKRPRQMLEELLHPPGYRGSVYTTLSTRSFSSTHLFSVT